MDNAAIKAYSSVIADAAEDSEPAVPVQYAEIKDEARADSRMAHAPAYWENSKHLNYDYQVGEKVLVRSVHKAKYKGDPYIGPYKITAVNNNGTVRYKKGTVINTINIRQIKPYFT